MKITNNTVVSFHYTVKNDQQQQLESSLQDEPIVYLHGHNNMLSGLEKALEGKSSGDKVSVTLPPADAYGEIQPNMEQRIPLKHISGPKKLKPGMVALVQTKHGQQQVTILKVGHTMVTVDGNHPFAGLTLNFEIEILDVREATEEEISHRHVHGAGGHHH